MIAIINPYKLGSVKEILADATRVYLMQNDASFMPADFETAFRSIISRYRQKCFIRIAMENGLVVGFVIADYTPLEYAKEKVMSLRFFATSLKGLKAANLLVKLHDLMVEDAKANDAHLVLSSASYLDTSCKLGRILAYHGWESRGNTSIYKIREWV